MICARDSTKDIRFLDCTGISGSSVVVLACASMDPSLPLLYVRSGPRRLWSRCSRLIVSFEFVRSVSTPGEDVSVSLSLSLSLSLSRSLVALLIDNSGRFKLGLLESGLFVRYCSICEKALAMVLRGDRGVGVGVASVRVGRGESGMRDRDAEMPARRI